MTAVRDVSPSTTPSTILPNGRKCGEYAFQLLREKRNKRTPRRILLANHTNKDSKTKILNQAITGGILETVMNQMSSVRMVVDTEEALDCIRKQVNWTAKSRMFVLRINSRSLKQLRSIQKVASSDMPGLVDL
jgi:hypothetical protein